VGVRGSLYEAHQRHLRWEKQATEALREAYELNHPILIFQALTIFLKIRIGTLLDECLDAINHHKKYLIEPSRRATFQRMFDDAARLNAESGSEEGRLQLDDLKMDFFEVQGDIGAAKNIAAALYPVATAMGIEPISRRAKELLHGDTLLMRYERELKASEGTDKDVEGAAVSDEQLARIAQHFFEAVETPVARYEVVLQRFRAVRQMAQERMKWCRHLVMLEDLSKSKIRETAYSELASRICKCEKFGHETKDGSVDATIVIADFKKTYCGTCQSRDPKQR